MVEHGIIQAVFCDGVIDVVSFIGIPVLAELFRAEDEDGFVSILVVFDDGERSECLTEPDTVSQDSSIVFLELIDDCKYSVFLKIVEHLPDLTLLEACQFIREIVF